MEYVYKTVVAILFFFLIMECESKLVTNFFKKESKCFYEGVEMQCETARRLIEVDEFKKLTDKRTKDGNPIPIDSVELILNQIINK